MQIRLGQFVQVDQMNIYPKDVTNWIAKYQSLRPAYVFTLLPIGWKDDGKTVEAYLLTIYRTIDGHTYGSPDTKEKPNEENNP